jgi:hypothetical protein
MRSGCEVRRGEEKGGTVEGDEEGVGMHEESN